ncbi:hypothetical protein AYI70_g9273 [Smittium culicis]|uniref:Uncharacterized protein n=1 Tax=Smittium culicis TaxID=133412 RepID=A0A1R1XC43_9FUNG|nr:hypothetical protein AYI70_g9273 [Smittium culicis]
MHIKKKKQTFPHPPTQNSRSLFTDIFLLSFRQLRELPKSIANTAQEILIISPPPSPVHNFLESLISKSNQITNTASLFFLI